MHIISGLHLYGYLLGVRRAVGNKGIYETWIIVSFLVTTSKVKGKRATDNFSGGKTGKMRA